ncbi:MAG: trypsin-like peptidase domain-containing protein [Bacteroidetes bacterium]|nr:trypsin-like peptidase domain-containing protein [Bacteroidota bacterium]
MRFKGLSFLSLIFILGSCASILNGKNQKSTVTTQLPGAKVYVDDVYAGKGDVVGVRLKRDFKVKEIRVDAEGYKSERVAVYQHTKSPFYMLSVVPFGILLLPPLTDNGMKSWDFDRRIAATPSLKIVRRKKDEKYLFLKTTAVNLKKEDFKIERYLAYGYKKGKKARKTIEASEEVEIENTIFTDVLNRILTKNNFSDSTSKILQTKTNTLYINASINKLTFKEIWANSYTRVCLVASVTIDWRLVDVYGLERMKQTLSAVSGQFSYDLHYSSRATMIESVEDAITGSFYKFLDAPDVRKLIQAEKEGTAILDKLLIDGNGPSSNSLESAQSATVTIVSPEGHGSGCIVSNDGYILTAFHVVAGNDEVEVIFKNGTKKKGRFVRANEAADIALIKVEGQFESKFKVPSNREYEVGQEVYAIGTPTSIELGQTLTKGIVSGLRNLGNVDLIQTDVSVNPGNSGGPIVSSKGQIVGLVNSKLVGTGIEGIAFGVPAEKLLALLSIEYK